MSDQIYAIVDIETTGGKAHKDRITEIAIFLHNGVEIIDSYHTLINPERYIPPYITSLTGINNDMVRDAPKFYEVAKEIYQFTENAIFVAHNVNFDYYFVRNHFTELGGRYDRKKLCTVKLSRKIIPGYPSYSLGNLCEQLGIPIEARHRAHGDAEATAHLFTLLLKADQDQQIAKALKRNGTPTKLPSNLKEEAYHRLPEAPGVYYFHDASGEVIYVGKAKNIRKRMDGHFSTSSKTFRNQNIFQDIYDITFELCGSELMALVVECLEIKRLWPRFNRAMKRKGRSYGIYMYEDRQGYCRFTINRVQARIDKPIISFAQEESARHFLTKVVKDYALCPKLSGLQTSVGACFDYHLKLCDGACDNKVTPEEYNARIEEALKEIENTNLNCLITLDGRSPDEKGVILIEKGQFKGYGYVDGTAQVNDWSEVKGVIKRHKTNPDMQKIIGAYLRKEPKGVVMF